MLVDGVEQALELERVVNASLDLQAGLLGRLTTSQIHLRVTRSMTVTTYVRGSARSACVS